MVAVVFVLSGLAFGIAGSVSVFLVPLSEHFGWSRSEGALGYTAVAFSSALFGMLWGAVADRFGTRWFGIVASIAMAGCLFGLASQTALWQFYLYHFLFGALGNGLVSSPLFANVGFWFSRRPGLALGITAAGGAFGQGVVPYCAGWIIGHYDWQTAYAWLAFGYLAIAFPIAWLIREPPARAARLAGSTQAPAALNFVLAEREVVVWISIAVIFCCNCMAVPIVHLVPLLVERGLDTSSAASYLLVLMLAGVAGRIAGGRTADAIGALPAYIIMSLGQTLTVIWFALLSHPAALYGIAIAFGFTYSGVMSCILVCTRMMVSPGFGGRAIGITSFFGWLGMGMGGFVGGALYDRSGDYMPAYTYAALMGAINLAVLLAFAARIRAMRSTAAPVT